MRAAGAALTHAVLGWRSGICADLQPEWCHRPKQLLQAPSSSRNKTHGTFSSFQGTLQVLGCLLPDRIFYFPRKLSSSKMNRFNIQKASCPDPPRGGKRARSGCAATWTSAHTGILKAWPTNSSTPVPGAMQPQTVVSASGRPRETDLPLCPAPKDKLSLVSCFFLPHSHVLSHFLRKQNLLLSTSLCLTAESLEASFFFLFLLVPECPLSFCLLSKYPERIASFSFRILASHLGS